MGDVCAAVVGLVVVTIGSVLVMYIGTVDMGVADGGAVVIVHIRRVSVSRMWVRVVAGVLPMHRVRRTSRR